MKRSLTPAQLAIGDPIENSIGMVLVPIPPGESMTGSPESEEDRDDDATQHRVANLRNTGGRAPTSRRPIA
jgi:formylglycine-generating enzyme required for sulfatase activity